jgi:hypothetical protein
MPTPGFCSAQAPYLRIPVIVTHLITTYNSIALSTTTLRSVFLVEHIQKFPEYLSSEILVHSIDFLYASCSFIVSYLLMINFSVL